MIRESAIVKHLQEKVIKHFGKQITTATDCENLAGLLWENYGANVSSQTLRRFFGLIKSTSKSSLFTLDILSKFCGFRDFENFRQSCSNSELQSFFGSAEDTGKNYWKKSEELCRQISDSPEMLITTHSRLMSFPLARKYFMENHPMRDMLGTVYSQYFLSYLKFNQSNEAKIFAYGFLFHSAFLLDNHELMELFYRKVAETVLTEEIHVIPAGLKFGVQLLYADFINDETLYTQTFEEMKEVRLMYIQASEKSVCSFEYTVLESLIFTDRTQDIKFLIENNCCQKGSDQLFVPVERKQTHDEVWNILCAAGYQKIGNLEETKIYLKKVNLENLGIGWKKYYSLLYYWVQLGFSEGIDRQELITKLKNLIEETHFIYFETKFRNMEQTKWCLSY